MIVRIRQGVCNVPVCSIVFLLGFILFIVIQTLWLPAEIHWTENIEILTVLIVVLIMNVSLFLRWCIVRNGVIICQTLFRKVEMSQETAHIEFEKDWFCRLVYLPLILLDWFTLLPPKWITLSDSSQNFTLGFSAYARERDQSLTDIIDALAIKTKEIDLVDIKRTADYCREIAYWTYFTILLFAIPLLVVLLMAR